MRIGIDMLAVQSPISRHRGIGRYGRNLLAALLARDPAHQYVLYVHDGLPAEALPTAPHAAVRTLAIDPARGERTMADALDRLVRLNPDGLDALLVLSPMEAHPGYAPPARPLNGLRMLAVVYDLIPFLFPERYLADPRIAARLYEHLRRVRGYDALLAISEATRADCLRVLGLPDQRVVTIGTASDGRFFVPDRSWPLPAPARAVLDRLGIDRPFVYCLSGNDSRKNLRGLIDAFRLLPDVLRRGHQLVVTGVSAEEAAGECPLAAQAGVAEHLVLTGEVPDADLRVLYQRCAAFAFPSRYEGFGLPLLEAMHCGAAVLAGHNSAQPEVVGDAGLLVNADDPWDLAEKLGRLLADAPLARSLGDRAAARARRFLWDRTAACALEVLERRAPGEGTVRVRADRAHAPRPRIALFSPLPPRNSGIADYAVRLLAELRRFYAIDLFHDPAYVPDLGIGSAEFACYDHRLFARLAAVNDYRGVLYQMGNSHYHEFLYEMLLQHPGVVTLHDLNLAGFHFWRSLRAGGDLELFRREIEGSEPWRAGAILAGIDHVRFEPGGVPGALNRREIDLNGRVFAQSRRVIVHSPQCLERVRASAPAHAGRAVVVPMGAEPRTVSPPQRAAIRARFDLPADALIFASFGILNPAKLNVEAIEAFAPLAPQHPAALLLLVGEDQAGGEARRAAAARGLGDRVRILGRQPAADFADLIAAADVGVSLRRPPSHGETSATLLDLLAAGVATIVTAVGTFADYPEAVVRTVRWDAEGPPGLARAMADLAGDPAARAALGRAALRHVEQHHRWSRTAAGYVAAIEHCHQERLRTRTRGPHRRGGAAAASPSPQAGDP